MENIDDCVAAFRTSKGGESENERKAAAKTRQQMTAGRYGIGLTLCLLHAQRLVPGSFASITSASESSSHWTRARFVVDAQHDSVLCVKQEKLPKSRDDESGTAVSLLVPGGESARRAWPRLAEYFARFHLSRGLQCSLQVMAPTLSQMPLYVRPPIETKDQSRKKKCKENLNQNDINIEGYLSNELEEEEDWNWNDGIFDDEDFGGMDNSEKDDMKVNTNYLKDYEEQKKEGKESHVIRKSQRANKYRGQMNDESDEIVNDQRDQESSYDEESENDSESNRVEKKPVKLSENDLEERKSIQRAAEAYLNCPVELKNVAHSVQPIRGRYFKVNAGKNKRSRKGNSITPNCPMLEVDMIVYRPDENDFQEEEVDQQHDNFEGMNEAENIFDKSISKDDRPLKEEPVMSENVQHVAKLMLVRMVNRIPLLDGAEAHACGLVRGISSKVTTWGSFGLDVSPDNEQAAHGILVNSSSQNSKNGETLSELQLHIPVFIVKDSIQIAPYFQSSTHALFEPNDDIDEHDMDYDDNSHEDELGEFLGDSSSFRCSKRRRRLLPAGLRIGNMLVIAQIHARPSALPLPTLSKGRLPMNDPAIDNAFEVGLQTCLRSLQQTNPSLLLTTQELKRTERDTRHVPAVAAAVASIICNSRRRDFRNRTVDKILRWSDEKNHEHVKGNENAKWDEKYISSDIPSRLAFVTPPSSSRDFFPTVTTEQIDSLPMEEVGRRRSSMTPQSSPERCDDSITTNKALKVNALGPLLEERLRFVLSCGGKNGRKKKERQDNKMKKKRKSTKKENTEGKSDGKTHSEINSDLEMQGEGNNENEGFDLDDLCEERSKMDSLGAVSEENNCSSQESDEVKSITDDFDESSIDLCENDVDDCSPSLRSSKEIEEEPIDENSQNSNRRMDECDDFDDDEWW